MSDLNTLETGKHAFVRTLTGDKRFISRTSAMGFTPDTPLMMLQNIKGAPVLVYLRDTQVALGRKEAAKIQITRSDG